MQEFYEYQRQKNQKPQNVFNPPAARKPEDDNFFSYNMEDFVKLNEEQIKWLIENAYNFIPEGLPLNEYRLTCAKASYTNKNYCLFAVRAFVDWNNHFNTKEVIFKSNWFVYDGFLSPAKHFDGFCRRIEGSIFNDFLNIFELNDLPTVKVKNSLPLKNEEELIKVLSSMDDNKRQELLQKAKSNCKRQRESMEEEKELELGQLKETKQIKK
jgi:hypothetical protein